MNDSNLKKFKENLIHERDLLIARMSNKDDLSVDDSETPDPVDLAVRNYSKNVMLAVSEGKSRQLTLVNEALERIEDEDYGICQHCEQDIIEKRLNAVPWARYCLDCQELQEQGMLDDNE